MFEKLSMFCKEIIPSSRGQQQVLNDNKFHCKHLGVYLSFISLATETWAKR